MQFLPGVDRLIKARDLLDQGGQETAGSTWLVEAALNCWSGIIDSAAWPVELRMEAMMLQRNMFRHGSIEATISQMSPTEREQLAQEIVHLATAAERTSAL